MKSFAPNILGLEVLTPEGYKRFAGVAHMGDFEIYRVLFGRGRFLECTSNHRILTRSGFSMVEDLRIGDWAIMANGRRTRVKSISTTGRIEPVYDLIEVDGHKYSTNSIVSHNCEFVTDDDTLINPLTLARLRGLDPLFYTGTVRWYAEPEPNKTFLVALDPSLGTKNDYAAIQVFQLPEMIQIAEWQNNESAPRRQVAILMEILYALDGILQENPAQKGRADIYWTFENNTIGEAILTIVEDTGEDRFPGSLITERRLKGLQTKRIRKGLHTTNRSRLSSLARLKSLIESGRMIIHSRNLIKELKNFVSVGNVFKAKPGEHDDLVMATSLAVRMIDSVLLWGIQSGNGGLREYIRDDELEGLQAEIEEPMPVVL